VAASRLAVERYYCPIHGQGEGHPHPRC
jgi:hypothetical protein